MLYLSTRNCNDAFTAYKALTQSECLDGGRYVPFRLPSFSGAELDALKEKPFNQIVADILNIFFTSRLTGWEVESSIGRNPVKLVSMNRRILIAELWHNLQRKYSYVVSELYKTVSGCAEAVCQPSNWFCVAVRIAVLFGLYGQMLTAGHISAGDRFDVSVSVDDFSAPMAAWYARKMGLPIETIICTDVDDNVVWDFVHRGTLNPIGADSSLLSGVERLVCATQGNLAVHKYIEKTLAGRIYSVSEECLPEISKGFFCSVAGNNRVDTVINSVYRTNGYLIDPGAALQFGGLQDYRAKTGESRITVLLSEVSPSEYLQQISAATGVSVEELMLRKES